MASSPASRDTVPEPPWPNRNEVDCAEISAGLADYIGQHLPGLPDQEQTVVAHLAECLRCARAFLGIFDLITASQLNVVLNSWIEPEARLSPESLEGMLALGQIQLAAAELVEDPRVAGRALSLLAMLRRHLGDEPESRLIHQMVLDSARETGEITSRALSHTDLGYLALSQGQALEAIEHLEQAQRLLEQVTDRAGESRVHLLLGQAWEGAGNDLKAQDAYRRAIELAHEANFSPGLAAASNRLTRSVTATTNRLAELVEALGPLMGGLGQQFQALRRILDGVGGVGAAQLDQLTRFYAGLLQPRLGFASGGDRVLVLNTAEEIGIRLVAGPTLNRSGQLSLWVVLGEDALAHLPEQFAIDLVFLPVNETVSTIQVADEERLRLQTARGLEISAALPGIEGFLGPLGDLLDQEGRDAQDFPRTALSLRIWW